MKIDHSNLGKVAVLLGGRSAERAISLRSGQAVHAALIRLGVAAEAVDTGINFYQQLVQSDFDRAFVMLHGRGGEDGVIQGALETLGLPYTGSGVLASALGMDKYRTKLVWKGLGIPTPDFAMIVEEADLHAVVGLEFPLIVKPVHEGSSIGITRVESESELEQAWIEAQRYDGQVMAERWIQGAEYTVGIVDREPLPLIRLETPNSFYDFEAKYQSGDTRYLCPCGLADTQEKHMQSLALRAFDAIGASGWGRVDLMVDENQTPWLIEINTVPGMTDHSLVPMAAKERGVEFDELVLRILLTSMRES